MKLTVAKKLSFSFFALILFIAGIAGFSYYETNNVNSLYEELLDDRVLKEDLVQQMIIEIKDQQVTVRSYLLDSDEYYIDQFQLAVNNYNELSNHLEGIVDETGANYLAQLNQLQEQYEVIANEAILMKQEERTDDMISLLQNEGSPIIIKFAETSNQFLQYQQMMKDDFRELVNSSMVTLISTLLIVSTIALLFAAAVTYIISKQISKPVLAIANGAEKIANGDLTGETLQIKNRDELGRLAESFNKMHDNLKNMIFKVSDSANDLSASSEQLSASAEQTSSATNQIALSITNVSENLQNQSDHVDETNQTVGQMAVGIQQITNNVVAVTESATDVQQLSDEGSAKIKDGIKQMGLVNNKVSHSKKMVEELGVQSKEISQIVDLINNIADQTNLLALNAAIESARAGEAGRGFAVVADEVRKLAEKSTKSTKQISTIVEQIQLKIAAIVEAMDSGAHEVNKGVTAVNQTGEAFKKIQKAVNNTAGQMQDVSAAAQQLASGSDEVTKAMNDVRKLNHSITGQSQEVSVAAEEQLSSMEEVSHSANQLADMAEELQELVMSFKV
ncbi:hypothetical protein BKP35_10245 [Anaerobacillus arseniciselenatis]|uniref:Methyl-accepting chemotaxis protein n=1 Tax=Anaerobacillus arseniciselenatis TaxID=85682 RepID=A0A1S2LND7_9BACI|nr:methyl-accepting chemotaxis protein [Anaerobacillus arseniciselenatis]OIJ12935.1 hypothetical protein BKP35_10245 [Anaerobacillus arseniciselenatis]